MTFHPNLSNQTPPVIQIALPAWAEAEWAHLPQSVPDEGARLELVLKWALQNVEAQTGGPFAAGVFDRASGRLISMGVNRVMPENCSSAHAEIVALSLAQQRLGVFSLCEVASAECELVVSWRPCAMCFGALPWSGIRSLLIAGSGPELEAITGFDEGAIHPDWQRELEARGIAVREAPYKEEALGVFHRYMELGGRAYNGRG